MINFLKLSPSQAEKLEELVRLLAEVFEEPFAAQRPPGFWDAMLTDNRLHAWAALHDGVVVGGLTAFRLPDLKSGRDMLYLYDLAVLPAFQRQGIATTLVQQLIAWEKAEGFQDVFVQSDVEDDHALAFYRALGGVEMDVKHFGFPL